MAGLFLSYRRDVLFCLYPLQGYRVRIVDLDSSEFADDVFTNLLGDGPKRYGFGFVVGRHPRHYGTFLHILNCGTVVAILTHVVCEYGLSKLNVAEYTGAGVSGDAFRGFDLQSEVFSKRCSHHSIFG